MSKKVPFVSEVEEFNSLFRKINNYTPTVAQPAHYAFVYNFLKEELEEYREACEKGDLVGIADALGDLMYVLCNGIMLHGVKDCIEDIYAEIHASNLSKVCKTKEEALDTIKIRTDEFNIAMHYEQVGNEFIVYRTVDRKVMKSVGYFKPNLKQFLN
jgi:predicted HAD superfamily Cof-like phosphohydrolase